MKNAVRWAWMQRLFHTGTSRAHEALLRYGTPDALLSLSDGALAADEFLTPGEKKAVASPKLEPAARLCEQAVQLGWTPLTPEDADYPKRLAEIHSPPLLLWTKGDRSLLRETYAVTVVGMRVPDEYGQRAARKITTELALCGAVIVSGFARGIDSLAHESALAVGGKTVAVLAAGPDLEYPSGSASLRKRIEESGLLLTEYLPGTSVRRGTFHVRNRLLSGLSPATVVVQAAHHSGALITAGHALAQDRDLYAVCGDIFSPKMAGCHELLLEGALPVFSGVELLKSYEVRYGEPLCPLCPVEEIPFRADPENLPFAKEPSQKSLPKKEKLPPPAQTAISKKPVIPDFLSEKQRAVFCACTEEEGFDAICALAALPSGEVLSILTQLEIFGLLEALPGSRYRVL